jgi:hypothetical protein
VLFCGKIEPSFTLAIMTIKRPPAKGFKESAESIARRQKDKAIFRQLNKAMKAYRKAQKSHAA